MKKIFTLSVIILSGCRSFSQDVDRGNVLLGGAVSFSRQHQESNNIGSTSRTFLLSPSVGRFYAKNRAAGVNLSFGTGTQATSDNKFNSYGVGFFLRQYVPLGRSFYIFAEEGVSGNYSKTKQNGFYKSESKVTSANLYFYPGLAYSLTKHFQIELSLGTLAGVTYQKEKRSQTDDVGVTTKSDTNTFSINAGDSNGSFGDLSFGVKWLL